MEFSVFHVAVRRTGKMDEHMVFSSRSLVRKVQYYLFLLPPNQAIMFIVPCKKKMLIVPPLDQYFLEIIHIVQNEHFNFKYHLDAKFNFSFF